MRARFQGVFPPHERILAHGADRGLGELRELVDVLPERLLAQLRPIDNLLSAAEERCDLRNLGEESRGGLLGLREEL